MCCGVKSSLCWIIISIWGILQLSLMGVFYYFHSVALAEDLPGFYFGENKDKSKYFDKFYEHIDTAYWQNALNCWIAAGLYILVLFISTIQYKRSTRSTV